MTSKYAVIYIDPTGAVESVVARGMDYNIAADLADMMRPKSRPGFYFTALNERDLDLP